MPRAKKGQPIKYKNQLKANKIIPNRIYEGAPSNYADWFVRENDIKLRKMEETKYPLPVPVKLFKLC